jgi:hypothetical protein
MSYEEEEGYSWQTQLEKMFCWFPPGLVI